MNKKLRFKIVLITILVTILFTIWAMMQSIKVVSVTLFITIIISIISIIALYYLNYKGRRNDYLHFMCIYYRLEDDYRLYAKMKENGEKNQTVIMLKRKIDSAGGFLVKIGNVMIQNRKMKKPAVAEIERALENIENMMKN